MLVINAHHRLTSELTKTRKETHRYDSMWRKNADDSFVTVIDVARTEPEEEGAIRTSTRGRFSTDDDSGRAYDCSQTNFEQLNSESKVKKTKVTFSLKLEKSKLRTRDMVEADALVFTRHLSELRCHFDKSRVIDKEERDNFVQVMNRQDEVYSDYEGKLLAEGMLTLKMYNELGAVKTVRREVTGRKKHFSFLTSFPLLRNYFFVRLALSLPLLSKLLLFSQATP